MLGILSDPGSYGSQAPMLICGVKAKTLKRGHILSVCYCDSFILGLAYENPKKVDTLANLSDNALLQYAVIPVFFALFVSVIILAL